MSKFTNNKEIPITVAAWLLQNNYDYITDPLYYSATELLKPVRATVLSRQMSQDDAEPIDIYSLVASALGNTVHDSLENVWKEGKYDKLSLLGYPKEVLDNIVVNPDPDDDTTGRTVVHVEQRHYKKVGKYTIGGKYDIVTDGVLQDYKTTSVWAWIKGGREEEYRLQGSIYRFLSNHIITHGTMKINMIFKDWSERAFVNAKEGEYPHSPVVEMDIELLSEKDTEKWIKNRLSLIEENSGLPQSKMIRCTDEELWRDDPIYQYFSKPTNTRASKNFKEHIEARAWLAEKGVGEIRIKEGEVKRCNYCSAAPICEQRLEYFTE